MSRSIRCVTLMLSGVLFFGVFSQAASAKERHALFTAVLSAHVQNGLVDYQSVCQDQRLDGYLKQLSATDPESLSSKEEKMAFWINAYNAFTLELICQNYPVASINELHAGGLILGSVLGKTAWDRKFIMIAGKPYSLGQIEHKILRPIYKDPRIHYAIVCAAKSCPPLRSEAFEGFRLAEQLNDQGKVFLSVRNDLNAFDLNKRTAHISAIFSWFRKDFGRNSRELLLHIAEFVPSEVSDDIKRNVATWRIRHKNYDWGLNEQPVSD